MENKTILETLKRDLDLANLQNSKLAKKVDHLIDVKSVREVEEKVLDTLLRKVYKKTNEAHFEKVNKLHKYLQTAIFYANHYKSVGLNLGQAFSMAYKINTEAPNNEFLKNYKPYYKALTKEFKGIELDKVSPVDSSTRKKANELEYLNEYLSCLEVYKNKIAISSEEKTIRANIALIKETIEFAKEIEEQIMDNDVFSPALHNTIRHTQYESLAYEQKAERRNIINKALNVFGRQWSNNEDYLERLSGSYPQDEIDEVRKNLVEYDHLYGEDKWWLGYSDTTKVYMQGLEKVNFMPKTMYIEKYDRLDARVEKKNIALLKDKISDSYGRELLPGDEDMEEIFIPLEFEKHFKDLKESITRIEKMDQEEATV